MQVRNKWTAAFTASDVDALSISFRRTRCSSALAARPSPAIPVKCANILNKPSSTRSRVLAKLLSYSVRVLSDSAVVVTGLDVLTGVRDGNAYTAPGRVTFVVSKQGDDWKIVHFHLIDLPCRGDSRIGRSWEVAPAKSRRHARPTRSQSCARELGI